MYWGNPVNPTYLATTAQLADWIRPRALPDNAQAFLRVATRMVLEASAGAFYAVDTTTGVATDVAVQQPLADATCAQASALIVLGIDPATGGAYTATVKSSARLGSAGYTLADAAQATSARLAATRALVPEAATILQQANLLGAGPWTFG